MITSCSEQKQTYQEETRLTSTHQHPGSRQLQSFLSVEVENIRGIERKKKKLGWRKQNACVSLHWKKSTGELNEIGLVLVLLIKSGL